MLSGELGDVRTYGASAPERVGGIGGAVCVTAAYRDFGPSAAAARAVW